MDAEINDWLPTLDEYNPKITKEQWIEFVQDKNIFDENALITFACIQKAKIPSCSDMAEEFGRTKNFYNTNNWRTGERIYKKINCPLLKRENENDQFWPVCCLGRWHQNGHFEFKIRPELQEVFEETGVLEGVEVMEKNSHTRFWSGGIKWGDEDKLSDFRENGYWQIGWENPDDSKGARQAWNNIKEVQVGDFLAFHGYGGQNDLKIYQISKVIKKDESKGVLYFERLDSGKDKLFHGKAPKLDKGGWFGTLFEITGKSAINTIFGQFLQGATTMQTNNPLATNLADLLTHTHNIILHGAPGTGKTFLAKQIAATLGAETGFVQFHPSYDYTDFVEGLRPANQDNGQIGFERKDGVFKEFCKRALKNLTDSKKSEKELGQERAAGEKIDDFIDEAIENQTKYETIGTKNEFHITEANENTISISIPNNPTVKNLALSKKQLEELLKSEKNFEKVSDITKFFNKTNATQRFSYLLVLCKEIQGKKSEKPSEPVSKVEKKNFVFIIDEINRGDLSKIFGELFFCIEPGYRGTKGLIQTQYQNLVEEGDAFSKGFFIPENVYIIGTMNDIDRSVEMMDFAFRRRFTFKEILASDAVGMLDEKTDEKGEKTGLPSKLAAEAKTRMKNLNDAISAIDELSSAYHIGGAYFLKLNELDGDFDKLWDYHLEPLLKEYLRGTENEKGNFEKLKNAYFNSEAKPAEESATGED